jgi:GntR family transcriptional regulator of abcA and norABC
MLTIDWLPNSKDSLPLYQQITAYIKNKITLGE